MRVGVERGPRPNIASALRRGLRGRDVLLLGVAEAPNFVALDALARNAAHGRIMELSADRAGFGEELVDRVDAHVGDAADRPHRRAFAEHREDLDALGEGQLVHAPII